jgi:hypothetical protein
MFTIFFSIFGKFSFMSIPYGPRLSAVKTKFLYPLFSPSLNSSKIVSRDLLLYSPTAFFIEQ